MKKFNIIFLVFILSACSTIRMRYESVVKTEDGKENKFSYENSYPVGGAHSTLCAITGIFFGGSCWFYLVMPTVNQQDIILEDADIYLKKTMSGKKFQEDKIRITKVSYEERSEQAGISEETKPYLGDAQKP